MQIILISLLILNIVSYTIMCIDKLKAVYNWWRISERTLWILAMLGGVWGIWLAMQVPLYHKAGKGVFRTWIPIIAACWLCGIIYLLSYL